ncbi:Very-long-chain 3-oxoacyl-CoA reductase-like protein [Capsicum annuum]|uniref:Very-long-chain 3-oxoacyl-CoA reductase-like protein n=1 Tax=Capsicum annuum TaxID=4072 RepID=A0A2G2YFL7_CAPAN|nr:Very-long-chain 3-oxoacyl-CoA reductase-like protein [Capsicum annuum]
MGRETGCFLKTVDWMEWEEASPKNSEIKTGLRLSKIWPGDGLERLAIERVLVMGRGDRSREFLKEIDSFALPHHFVEEIEGIRSFERVRSEHSISRKFCFPILLYDRCEHRYIDKLSRCLYVEYKHHGIDVQCQVPLYVKTAMSSRVVSIEKSSLFSPSAEKYAKTAVAQIGSGWRSMPYWPHSLQWWFASLLPEPLLDAWRLSVGINSFYIRVKFKFSAMSVSSDVSI